MAHAHLVLDLCEMATQTFSQELERILIPDPLRLLQLFLQVVLHLDDAVDFLVHLLDLVFVRNLLT